MKNEKNHKYMFVFFFYFYVIGQPFHIHHHFCYIEKIGNYKSWWFLRKIAFLQNKEGKSVKNLYGTRLNIANCLQLWKLPFKFFSLWLMHHPRRDYFAFSFQNTHHHHMVIFDKNQQNSSLHIKMIDFTRLTHHNKWTQSIIMANSEEQLESKSRLIEQKISILNFFTWFFLPDKLIHH